MTDIADSDPAEPGQSNFDIGLVMAALVLGAATGIAAFLTFLAMMFLQGVIWFAGTDIRWIVLPITLTGGILIGLVQRQSLQADLEAQIEGARHPEHVHLKGTAWMALAAIIAVGFGGAIGPEAGIIAVTAQLSSMVAMKLGHTAYQRRILAEAGLSGALSGLYGSPAGGPLYAQQRDEVPRPVLFAAGFAGFLAFFGVAELLVPGSISDMHLPSLSTNAERFDYIYALLPALGGAAIGAAFLASRDWLTRVISLRVERAYLRPVIGGALLGILCTASPLLLFSGHQEIEEVLRIGLERGPWPLLLLGLGKILACAICLAAGWRGGVIYPMCFAGAAVGGAVLTLVPLTDPIVGLAAGMTAASAVAMARPLVAGGVMLLILGGGLAGPVFVGTLVGAWILRLLPDTLTDADTLHTH